ncbi:hypothetical protein GOP47_0019418 [Adiantum capillus-veneris]|uniref:DNA repair protein REV1 n=1 Tax=Adiantum capillus-veneris TaxID=13818 RepID=A0A9D4UB02_ADICA|nr:hypothetical protein GOP47_0019418 [Adiantum capillus-veneris]
MAEKKRKLALQYQADASNRVLSTSTSSTFGSSSWTAELVTSVNGSNAAVPCNELTKLFNGISIFVDGFTTPSHQDLRDLMLEHGGMFQNYFSRDLVTHIICTTLPDSKIRDHRSFSRGLPIVKPSWIVDSISCGRVLPISLYAHERIAHSHPNQLTMSKFFDYTKEDARKPSYYRGIIPASEPSTCIREETPYEGQECIVNTDVVHDTRHLQSIQEPLCKENLESDLHIKNLVSSGARDDKKPVSCSENVRSHCALGDANFVQNYFKNSRLHFIGTWRSRYHNRFNSSRVEKDQQLENSRMLADNGHRIVMHVDMDCFFVSVVVRNQSELAGKPVVVCHSEKTQGTAEISSSNYAARAFGVRSGMFIRDAKALCPELQVVPYDFGAYEQVADQFYDVLHKHCKKVQAVSCDEAYVDVTGVEDPETLASCIREEVFDLTRCTASVGIAGNLLLARMATKKAKPDGQFRILPCHVEGFLSGLSVKELPGVGWSLQERLHSKKIYNCKQLQCVSKETLQHDFGVKTGDMLWCYARGIDNRQVVTHQERKSIGAEVNWGVRFETTSDAEHFLTKLCEEVSERLQNTLVAGRTFTIKIKRRKEGAAEPQKFMGCGTCDNLSKSITLGCATNSVHVMLRVSKQVFASFHLDVREIRGMGLQVTRLESHPTRSTDEGQQHQKALGACLQSFPTGNSRKCVVDNKSLTKPSKETLSSVEDALLWGINRSQLKEKKGMLSLGKICKGPFSGLKRSSLRKEKGKQALSCLPHHSELDQSVLASLPPDIIEELDDVYNRAVTQHFSSTQKPHSLTTVSVLGGPPALVQPESVVAVANKNYAIKLIREEEEFSGALDGHLRISNMESCPLDERAQTFCLGGTGADSESIAPLSLSQVDMATLEELPFELRKDILRSLPPHRCSNSSEVELLGVPEQPQSILPLAKISNPASISKDVLQLDGLWCGDPPKWVLQFETMEGAGTDALHLLSKAFFDCGCPKQFSCILLHAMCFHKFIVYNGVKQDSKDSVAFRCCLELFKQYLLPQVSGNLEEVFTVVRVLKRLAREGHFWDKIFRVILPSIQEATREIYGGSLL